MTKLEKAGIILSVIIHEIWSLDKYMRWILRDFMKNLRRICLLFLVLCIIIAAAAPAMAEPAVEVPLGSSGLDAVQPLGGNEQLLESAKAAILYELTSDTLVYAWNPDVQVDPSGMNKIMTALIALEMTKPEEIVTVSRTVVLSAALIGSVSAGLKVGEEISMGDLLYCMMVASANDASVVIAEHISSTEEQFVELMNQRAQELGCVNTHFVNASGLPQAGQYTTARDLAKLTQTALKNEAFAQLFQAVNYTVPATNKSEERYIVTTNYLTSKETVKTQFDNRVTGGKTGALSTTDRSLICTAENSGKMYLSVVMNARGTVTEDGLSATTFGSFEETRALLDYGFRQFSVRQVLQSGQVLDQFPVAGGENAVFAGAAEDMLTTLPADVLSVQVTYRCVLNDENLVAPIAAGQVIGSAEVWYRDMFVGRRDLVAINAVHLEGDHIQTIIPSAVPEEDHSLRNWLVLAALIAVGIVLLAGLVLLVIVFIKKYQLERRHRLINEGIK